MKITYEFQKTPFYMNTVVTGKQMPQYKFKDYRLYLDLHKIIGVYPNKELLFNILGKRRNSITTL